MIKGKIKHTDIRGLSISQSGEVVPGYEPANNPDKEYIPPEGGTGVIDIDLGSVQTPGIFKELHNLKRHNIVGKTMEESKTGHYVSYDDVLRLFHKYWGGQ